MPILTGDVLEHLSTDTGSSGGAIAGSTVTSGVINNVWPDISDADRIAGGEMFRKTFWSNHSGSDSMVAPVMFTPILPAGIVLSIGLGFDDADDEDEDQGNMLAFLSNNLVALVGSNFADVRSVTIWGLDDTGTPVSESIDLNGTTEVLSTTTFSKVWAIHTTADAGSVITISEGTGGDTRGLITQDKVCCWLWVEEPDTKAAGIALPDLPAGSNYGMWRRLAWQPEADPARPNTLTVSIEEA